MPDNRWYHQRNQAGDHTDCELLLRPVKVQTRDHQKTQREQEDQVAQQYPRALWIDRLKQNKVHQEERHLKSVKCQNLRVFRPQIQD